MRRRLLSFLLLTQLASFLWGTQGAEPIRLHPRNPHYFLWRDKPTVLVTSGEHYGAVLNSAFAVDRYLQTLKAHQFNLTRVFSGTYREVPGSFNIQGNTLAPAPGRFLCPWGRSDVPGAADGGNQFDLQKWDAVYFDRLKDFIRQADRHGVVVELVFFCTMYDDTVWGASPMNARNNVNGIGSVDRNAVFSGRDERLLAVQKAVTAKLVTELNPFDNLYFEVCNEFYERDGGTAYWTDQIVSTIAGTEAMLPRKHLIAEASAPSATAVANPNRRVSILNFHAATPASVRLNYGLNKVLAFDETGGADQSDQKYRAEGWQWLVAGGAVFDHLDFSFTVDRPEGDAVPLPPGTPGGGGPELRRQLRVLKEFIESFNFVAMRPDPSTIVRTEFEGAGSNASSAGSKPSVHLLSQPGIAYAAYVLGGNRATLTMDLPGATYRAEWIDPASGRSVRDETWDHGTGSRTLVSPQYPVDLALRLTRTSAPKANAGDEK